MFNTLVNLSMRRVPRYTSYPTAPHFSPEVDGDTSAAWLAGLEPSQPISLYFHVPFCSALCHYCGCHTKVVNRTGPVTEYAGLLEKEAALVARHIGRRAKVSAIHWGGGTPSIMPPEAFRSIYQHLHKLFDLSDVAEHSIELDPRHLDQALANRLAGLGVNRASLGVQDLSPRVQQKIGRPQPFGVIVKAQEYLRRAGITSLNFDLMYGLPDQTTHDVRRTATLVATLKPARIALFGYAHVPWFRKNQQLIDSNLLPGAAERLEQVETAKAVLTQSGYVAIGFDHYALPSDPMAQAARNGTLHRNFQGYTTDNAPILIGLGSSSISQFPQGHSQNAPDITAYRRMVTDGRLPTVRGVRTSEDDRVRADVIERLMCDLRVDLDAVADRHGVSGDLFNEDIENLAELRAYGLAEVDGHIVQITESGRPFVRIAAAAFDSYLRSETGRHSEAV